MASFNRQHAPGDEPSSDPAFPLAPDATSPQPEGSSHMPFEGSDAALAHLSAAEVHEPSRRMSSSSPSRPAPLSAQQHPTAHDLEQSMHAPRVPHEDASGSDGERHTRPVTVIPHSADASTRNALLVCATNADNLCRFRMLFVGLLLSLSSSTQGLHSVFGVLYLQQTLLFNVRQMTIIYLAGTAMGMFTFPFAVLYDWFGPRVPIAVASAIGALGHLLFALAFGGHITASVTHCAVFYAIMCWGCYGLLVVVVPSVPTHMPRDRGVPTAQLTSLASLGTLFFACLFRGFFEGNFQAFMWFLFAVVVAAGVAGTWYLEDAPHVMNRWRRRRITPRQQLRAFLLRNRYMSQLVPQRRYACVTVILTLLNLYLFIQMVCYGYLGSRVTVGNLRCIAIGSVVVVLLLLVLVVPMNAIDGLSEQEKEEIAAARNREAALRAMQADRRGAGETRGAADDAGEARRGAVTVSTSYSPPETGLPVQPAGSSAPNRVEAPRSAHIGDAERQSAAAPRLSDVTDVHPRDVELNSALSSPVFPGGQSPLHGPPHMHGGGGGAFPHAFRLPVFEQAQPPRPLIRVDVASGTHGGLESEASMQHVTRASKRSSHLLERTFRCLEHTETCDHEEVVHSASPPAAAASSPPPQAFTVRINSKPEHHAKNTGARVESINLCDEVYVLPVYESTFLQSLLQPEIWLMFYTSLCAWGVGYTMTGNWNIHVMLRARFAWMTNADFVLVSSLSSLAIVAGRLSVGTYERFLKLIREVTGITIVPTLIYPISTLGLFLGMILWIALPGNLSLLAAYIVSAYFFGMNTCSTVYVISTIYARDIGMHYGFCYLGAGIGFVLCYWCSWYLTYSKEATSGYCIGERRCMNRAVGIYLCLIFSSIPAAVLVHIRYWRLAHGEVEFRRVMAAQRRHFVSWFFFRPQESRPTGANRGEAAPR